MRKDLVRCPACRKKVSVLARSCPKCGHPILGLSVKLPGYGDEWKRQLFKRSGELLLLISLIIGASYMIYSIIYWGKALDTVVSGSVRAISSGFATALVLPHLAFTIVAIIFNAIGLFMYSRAFTICAAIFYTLALIFFPIYAMFVIVEMALCYIAFAKMKKKK